MELLIDRQQRIQAHHVLGGVGGIPEMYHDHLGVHLAQRPFHAFRIRQIDVREGGLRRIPDLVDQLEDADAAFGFLVQRLDVAGVGIDRLEGVGALAEQDRVRLLREHRAVAQLLEEHGDRGERERMSHHVFHAIAVVLDVDLRHLQGFVPVGQERTQEIGISLVHLGQLRGAFGALDGVMAERVGGHDRRFALLQEETRDAGVAVEQINEFRLAVGHFHGVFEGAVLAHLEGVGVAVGVDVQLFDDDLAVGGVSDGAADDGLVGAGGKGKRRQRGAKDLTAVSHIRKGLRRPSAPSVPA